MKKRLTFILTLEQYAWLKHHAEKLGISITEIVKRMIDDGMGKR